MNQDDTTGFEIEVNHQGIYKNIFKSWVFYLCLLFAIGAGYKRYVDPYFGRPIEIDERITLQEYTWAGINQDGTRNELRTHQQIAHIKGFTLRRLVFGCWASVGRWTEPNNHIAHSLMVNPSLLLVEDSLRAIRIPALLSAISFSVLCAAWCVRSGWYLSAPLATAISFYHPYVVEYSQSSRGYALMLLLCLLTLMLSESMLRSKSENGYAFTATVMTATMISLFLTIVNMIVDWIMPVFMAMGHDILSNKKLDSKARKHHLFRLVLPIVFVGYTVFLFACDRLPQLASSVAQYGVPFEGWNGFLDVLRRFLNYLAPNLGWVILFAFGLLGVFLMIRSQRSKLMGWTFVAASLISLLHFAVGGKFPYERNTGYFLIPVIFGVAQTYSNLFQSTQSSLGRLCLYIFGGSLVVSAIGPTGFVPGSDSVNNDIIGRLTEANLEIDENDIVVAGRGATELILCLDWQGVETSKQRRFYVLRNKRFPDLFEGLNHKDEENMISYLFGEPTIGNDVFDCWRKYIKEIPVLETTPVPQIVVWDVPMEKVTVSPDGILNDLRDRRMNFFAIHKRYQAKMSIYNRLDQIVFLIPPSEPESSFARMVGEIDNIVKKNGGKISFFAIQPDGG